MEPLVPLNRREAIARAAALLAGAALAPAAQGAPAASAQLDAGERRLLEELCETLLPQTDTPGARAADVHGFVMQMLRDWASPSTARDFRDVLRRVNAAGAGRFAVLAPAERLAALRRFDAAAYARSDETWPRLKELVLLGYYSSEIGATRELRYDPVPGEWRPCEPAGPDTRAWAV